MGTKVVPTYVNLVMAYLEIKLYQIIREKYGKERMDHFVKEWLRYLDDCFLNWDLTIDTTENLLKILHSLHPSIKFETEDSETEANYLDIKIIVKDSKIITDLFQKPTDSQHYVPFILSNPSHTKRNIPFDLARTICTIVEERNTKDQRLTESKNTLVKQGYAIQLLEFGAQKATEIPIVDLRQPKDKDKEDTPILTFVSTFNPRNPDMFKVMKDTLPLLNASPPMKKALKNIKLINSKHQPSNLKELLTRARFELSTTQKQEHQEVKKVHRCTTKTCLTCTVLEETDKVTFNSCQETFMIKNEMDYSCRDIIYLLTCGGYKTSNLRARVRTHKQQILDTRLRHLYVSHHIAHCAIGKRKLFTIVPFFSLNCGDKFYRIEQEQYFIHKYRPELNRDKIVPNHEKTQEINTRFFRPTHSELRQINRTITSQHS